ncbi:MAG: DUF1800 domain-containing protein [Phycisphaerales bacterium]|nr:MAG: DUF1800 domain-containing protein [Phycisphaerales bacterium]
MIEDKDRKADPNWAWAVYEPDARRPWTGTLAAHLYRRAGFGANWQQLQQAVAEGPQATVSHLLAPGSDVEAFDRTYDGYEGGVGSVNGLRAWWLRRMIETPHPLQEKMTLFWHGHFATNGAALKQTRLMREHLQLLRRHALGSFAFLLQALARDPALLLWLGADANRKAAPNENFARPLMETFTLGPGHFSDDDVREAARAFAGWFVLRDRLRYLPREHDAGTKHILGQAGEFTGEDVIRIVLEQPATPRTLVRKLYRWFICETDEPGEDLTAPLAESLAADYSISAVVETILRSNLFFSSYAYRQRVKSPVEFAVGVIHALEGMVSTTQLGRDVAGLGQDLGHPPTVKGWPDGRYWIDSIMLTRRHNLAWALLQGGDPYGDKLDSWKVAQRHGYADAESAAQFLLELFLQDDLDPDVREMLRRNVREDAHTDSAAALDRLTYAAVTLPEYHLA